MVQLLLNPVHEGSDIWIITPITLDMASNPFPKIPHVWTVVSFVGTRSIDCKKLTVHWLDRWTKCP